MSRTAASQLHRQNCDDSHRCLAAAQTKLVNRGVQVEHLVLETIQAVRKEGFSESAVAAALNSIEFSLRENNTGRFPRGLSMMLRAMGAWIYDRDPYTCAPH